jgi:hypothetical protein
MVIRDVFRGRFRVRANASPGERRLCDDVARKRGKTKADEQLCIGRVPATVKRAVGGETS